jgi:hypothetical protein
MIILRPTVILLLILFGQSATRSADAPVGETPEAAKANVLAVVQRFLDALAARDPVACKSTLAPEGQLQAMNEGGAKGPTISYRLLGDFADRLTTWKERPLERIGNPTVLLQGRIATVWAPYDFHREGKFSHSGIDVFTLMRAGDDWKIVNLAFNIQPQVPSQHPDGPPRK